MELNNILSFTILLAALICLTEGNYGLYNPYCGGCGFNRCFGGCGSCGPFHPYPGAFAKPIPSLKAKLLHKLLSLKKPCLLPKPCLPGICKPCLPCLAKPSYPCLPRVSTTCVNTATSVKYPACGPCPYASCIPKCLKHKATLALCS